MLRATVLALLALSLAACGRPLTETEKAFVSSLQGPDFAQSRIRVVEGAPVGSVTFRRQPRPRVACRERILPPPRDEIVTTKPAAVALFNKVYFVKDWYLPDYLPGYPDRLYLIEAMLLGHEMTHVWQWKNRDVTGYHPLRAALEHTASDDPYLFDVDKDAEFLSFGYEQQGAIVEEFVCCRALAPKGARTKRLHAMLAEVFDVAALPQSRTSDVFLPWDGAELDGICD
ncbi:hypothetical protein [Chachezhania antarctica]|uniref:hypothetical protein n=1 Tax=Chachezhania antarctica TaxID=2340860 RepID=UPI003B84645A